MNDRKSATLTVRWPAVASEVPSSTLSLITLGFLCTNRSRKTRALKVSSRRRKPRFFRSSADVPTVPMSSMGAPRQILREKKRTDGCQCVANVASSHSGVLNALLAAGSTSYGLYDGPKSSFLPFLPPFPLSVALGTCSWSASTKCSSLESSSAKLYLPPPPLAVDCAVEPTRLCRSTDDCCSTSETSASVVHSSAGSAARDDTAVSRCRKAAWRTVDESASTARRTRCSSCRCRFCECKNSGRNREK
mmetsp:Transcript_10537/g.33404  ORF Transcript_10537/g.33404 Transcript_10537/m.33404 type:complete len:248 (+) Transcript_10537:73-816(+)